MKIRLELYRKCLILSTQMIGTDRNPEDYKGKADRSFGY